LAASAFIEHEELLVNRKLALAQGRIADFVVKEPMVIGHESAG